jgi:hypothetical protein
MTQLPNSYLIFPLAVAALPPQQAGKRNVEEAKPPQTPPLLRVRRSRRMPDEDVLKWEDGVGWHSS